MGQNYVPKIYKRPPAVSLKVFIGAVKALFPFSIPNTSIQGFKNKYQTCS